MDDNFTIFIQIIYIAINYFSFALKKKKSQIIFPILYKSTSHCYINQISDNSLQKKRKKEKKKKIIGINTIITTQSRQQGILSFIAL